MQNKISLVRLDPGQPGDRLALLAQLSGQLIAAADDAQLASDLFALIAADLGLDAFLTYDRSDNGQLRFVTAGGIPEIAAGGIERLAPAAALLSEAAERVSTLHYTALQAANDLSTAFLKSIGLDSFICLPLVAGERVLGVLGFGRRWIDRFSADDIRFLETAAAYVAIAKERLRGEAALRASEQRLLASEARLRLAAQTAGLGIFDWDIVADQHVWTDELYAIYGLPIGAPVDIAAVFRLIHPDDAAAIAAAPGKAARQGSGNYSFEHRIIRPDGELRWLHVNGYVVTAGEGSQRRAIRVVGATQDITERRRSEEALRKSEERLRLAQELGGIGSFDWDVVTGVGELSETCQRILGFAPDGPTTYSVLRASIHPDDAERSHATLIGALRGDQPYDATFRIIRAIDGQERWIHFQGGMVRTSEGRAVRMVGVAQDVTEQRRDHEREQLLTREVDHRAKNLLTVIQAVVQLTRAKTIGEFTAAVTGRIQALGRAHSLLADSRWVGAELTTLVREELAPFGAVDERLFMHGPVVELRPAAAQSMALVLHELATNAAKYGALSVAAGRVAVTWTTDHSSGRLALHWQERGGPVVAPPARRGFGWALIERSIEHQLHGTVRIDWQPDGLVCELNLSAEQLVSVITRRPGRA